MFKKEKYDPKILIHFWGINIYVKIDKSLREKLALLIKKRYNSFNNFEKQTLFCRKTASAICKGYFTNSNKLAKLTDLLRLKREFVEKRIIYFRDSKTGAYNRTYKTIFPVKLSPTLIRIVSHLIGDGSIYEYHLKYGQIGNNVIYMKKLINFLIKPSGDLKINFSKKQYNGRYFGEIKIPMIFVKIICAYFSINKKDIKKEVYLEKILSLPRTYRVQTLCALYVDEGSISQASIRMKDKKIIEMICKLIDSLDYKRGGIKSFISKSCFGKHYETEYYGVNMFGEGFKKFNEDIKISMGEENNSLLNLWYKTGDFERKINNYSLKYIKDRELFIKNKIETIEIFKRKRIIKLIDFLKILKINRKNSYYLFNSLMSDKLIKRVGHGVYKWEGNN